MKMKIYIYIYKCNVNVRLFLGLFEPMNTSLKINPVKYSNLEVLTHNAFLEVRFLLTSNIR